MGSAGRGRVGETQTEGFVYKVLQSDAFAFFQRLLKEKGDVGVERQRNAHIACVEGGQIDVKASFLCKRLMLDASVDRGSAWRIRKRRECTGMETANVNPVPIPAFGCVPDQSGIEPVRCLRKRNHER